MAVTVVEGAVRAAADVGADSTAAGFAVQVVGNAGGVGCNEGAMRGAAEAVQRIAGDVRV